MLTHVGTNTIETKRLILRRFEYTDDDAMLKYYSAGFCASMMNKSEFDKFLKTIKLK